MRYARFLPICFITNFRSQQIIELQNTLDYAVLRAVTQRLLLGSPARFPPAFIRLCSAISFRVSDLASQQPFALFLLIILNLGTIWLFHRPTEA